MKDFQASLVGRSDSTRLKDCRNFTAKGSESLLGPLEDLFHPTPFDARSPAPSVSILRGQLSHNRWERKGYVFTNVAIGNRLAFLPNIRIFNEDRSP